MSPSWLTLDDFKCPEDPLEDIVTPTLDEGLRECLDRDRSWIMSCCMLLACEVWMRRVCDIRIRSLMASVGYKKEAIFRLKSKYSHCTNRHNIDSRC